MVLKGEQKRGFKKSDASATGDGVGTSGNLCAFEPHFDFRFAMGLPLLLSTSHSTRASSIKPNNTCCTASKSGLS
jgi:hypothetical protein